MSDNSNSNNFDSSNTQILLSQIIQNFYKIDIKEKEPTTQNIKEIILEEDLGIVVDDLVNLCLKEENEGKEEIVIKQHVIDYINNHNDGEGIGINYNKSFELLEMSAEKGHLNAISMLGYCHNHGVGTKVNMQKAFELYQIAANLGNSCAQYNLGLMYEDGNGVVKNIEQAIYWYKKSAGQGFCSAQIKLEEFS
ncbi:kinase-like domain-containing protein [Rhizophagus irregularis DAOM 181602=DAOM 197198]|nr:kinase-like domain-containing protein [Rhizophagus irregularis DAOM 181602=DAOM 197198]